MISTAVGVVRSAARTTYSLRLRAGQREERSRHLQDGAAPRRRRPDVRFAISGDADATPGRERQAGLQRFEVYGRMAPSATTSTSTSATRSTRTARSPARRSRARSREKWAKYKLGLALPALRRLRASAGLYSHWDDHEFINDFSRAENGAAIYAAGVKAFLDYAPVAELPGERASTARSAGARTSSSSSSTSARSAAPKADDRRAAATSRRPRRRRSATRFAALAPALANPVAARVPRRDQRPRADDARRAPVRRVHEGDQGVDRDLEGDRQRGPDPAVLRAAVRPLGGLRGRARAAAAVPAGEREERRLPDHRHAREPRQRRALPDARRSPESSGIWEVVTGPVATNTFAKEIDGTSGQKGAGTAIGALFFKPPPPNGVGMRCAALDIYSYAEVTVTAKRLTVALKDAKGRPVREATGAACAPLVLSAR